MSKNVQTLETKDVVINDNMYIITAMSATDGMDFMTTAQDAFLDGTIPAKRMKEIIIKYVSLGNNKFNEKSYDTHFSRKYNVLNELFAEIMEFNFGSMAEDLDEGEEENPNE